MYTDLSNPKRTATIRSWKFRDSEQAYVRIVNDDDWETLLECELSFPNEAAAKAWLATGWRAGH